MIGMAQGWGTHAITADAVGAALIDSQKRFQALAEVSLKGKLVHRRFRPLFANDAFALLCGLSGGEEVLAKGDVLTFLDEETRTKPERAWRLAMGGPFAGRRLLHRANGTCYPAELYARPIEWDGETAVAMAVIDVSAEESAQQALRQALGRAEDAERRRTLFIDATRRALEGPASTLKERIDGLVRQATQSPNALAPTALGEHARPRVVTLDILLVSEDLQTRTMMKLALSGLGHRPYGARSGAEAMAALRARPYGAVVADLAMMQMDGLALARAIRSLPGPTASTPIVAIAEPEATGPLREEIADAGIDALIGRFVNIPQLAETLRLLAGGRSVDAALGDQVQQGDDNKESDNDGGRTQGHRALHG
jgi:PAS domain S-box-containing protein